MKSVTNRGVVYGVWPPLKYVEKPQKIREKNR